MNILLVEDDNSTRTFLGQFLRDIGHHIIECDNGKDALQLFQCGEFHLVLSDIKMPGMSGIELLQSLGPQPSMRNADVILFTGYGNMETAIEALRAGALDYILKPINVKELAQAIDRVTERRALSKENATPTGKFEDENAAATKEIKGEIDALKIAFNQRKRYGEIVIYSKKTKSIFKQAKKYHGDRSIPVLIQGETGTGKEVVAKYIHYGGLNIEKPFIDVNCAALTTNLFESELFGYESGAFTGGLPRGQKGKLDLASGGTIFFDEITEIPIELQAKLLRVIQEKEFYRVGGLRKIRIDIRIICATNENIEKKLKEGLFRKDLYYRLNVGRLVIPPLRERKEEILPLATDFLRYYSYKKEKSFSNISDLAAKLLLSYSWPGNVRELKNAMEWVTVMHDDSMLKPSHLEILKQNENACLSAKDSTPAMGPDNFVLPPEGLDLEKFFNKIIIQALDTHKGNKTKAARYLGISRRSLQCRVDRIDKQLPGN